MNVDEQLIVFVLITLAECHFSFHLPQRRLLKQLACVLGAMDVPKDDRRMHKIPIARIGGLAIFLGFIGKRACLLLK
jgi:UDP-N-acetylmuramyl pentapeptide phosphotransferase/UDP-N-acetylglucosamine-1-phosphate transferase